MARVDMTFKCQTAISDTFRNGQGDADERARDAQGKVGEYIEEWSRLDRPLLRALDMAGLSECAKPGTKVAVFMTEPLYNGLRNVVLKGYYNVLRSTNLEMSDASPDSGVALVRTMFKARDVLVDAFNAAEVPAQDAMTGIFTFTQPLPKGDFAN